MKNEKIDRDLAQETKYPCLKYLKNKDLDQLYIVLFTGPRTGFVVYRGICAYYQIGVSSYEWTEDNFEIYTGKVILEN